MTQPSESAPDVDLDDATDDEVGEYVPDDAGDDWQPEAYQPGPDEPGDIDDECGDPEKVA